MFSFSRYGFMVFLLAGFGVASPALANPAEQDTPPAEIVFEKNIEYSNPDGQHLQLNMARPKNAKGPLLAYKSVSESEWTEFNGLRRVI